MAIKHTDLNKKRKEGYRKPPEQERFLETFNGELLELERSLYSETEPQHPFLFIFGLPRSGTTLLSQLIAHCLDVGFINNLAARFWKAPVTGIRLTQSVLDDTPFKAFESHYGATEKLKDIHEFGYFWRNWLQKDSFENIKNAAAIEEQIDWGGLRLALTNMQARFNRPMVFKNIFGSYHISRLNKVLGKVHWIYIERDPLDVTLSILQAREKYFEDLNTWWSYVPPGYEKIINLDYWHQIAGQVHYLKKYYHHQMDHLQSEGSLTRISYQGLCEHPRAILNELQERLKSQFNCEIDLVQEPPPHFEISRFEDHTDEKKKFQRLLEEFSQND